MMARDIQRHDQQFSIHQNTNLHSDFNGLNRFVTPTSMTFSRTQSISDLTQLSRENINALPPLVRNDSAHMVITTPNGDVMGESSTSIVSEDMFGSGHASPVINDEQRHGDRSSTTKPRLFAEPASSYSAPYYSDISSRHLNEALPYSPNVNALLDTAVYKLRDVELSPPRDNSLELPTPGNLNYLPPLLDIKTRTPYRIPVSEDVKLPAEMVKPVFQELVDTDWDVMSVCDQLIAGGNMNLVTYRACHEISKATHRPDWERILRREFLLDLMERPVSWKMLSEAIDRSRASHIKQYLCPGI